MDTQDIGLMRTEFGCNRVSCSCKKCTDPCRFIPGYLIPDDLYRIIPSDLTDAQTLQWVSDHLLASPGAIVMDSSTGETSRIPTLVLASKSKEDPSCVFLDANQRCTIHEKAPFGCAFFRVCTSVHDDQRLSQEGLIAISEDWNKPKSFYRSVWMYLYGIGRVSLTATEKRQRMSDVLAKEGDQ